MAITVEYLKGLDIDEETAKKIFAERGKEIEAEKTKAQSQSQKTESELTRTKENLQKMTNELNALKAEKATGEDWQKKFETLQAEVAENEKKAKEEAEAAEKLQSITERFNKANVDKDGKPREWYNDFTKNGYLDAFGKALEDKDNAGKADVDILNALVKEDSTAFKGVQTAKLIGGAPLGGSDDDEAMARAVMGLKPKE